VDQGKERWDKIESAPKCMARERAQGRSEWEKESNSLALVVAAKRRSHYGADEVRRKYKPDSKGKRMPQVRYETEKIPIPPALACRSGTGVRESQSGLNAGKEEDDCSNMGKIAPIK